MPPPTGVWVRREDERECEAVFVPLPGERTQVAALQEHIFARRVFPFSSKISSSELALLDPVTGAPLAATATIPASLIDSHPSQTGRMGHSRGLPPLVIAVRRAAVVPRPTHTPPRQTPPRRHPTPQTGSSWEKARDRVGNISSRMGDERTPVSWAPLLSAPEEAEDDEDTRGAPIFLEPQPAPSPAQLVAPHHLSRSSGMPRGGSGAAATPRSINGLAANVSLIDCCALIGSPLPLNWRGATEQFASLSPERAASPQEAAQFVGQRRRGKYLLPHEMPLHPLPMSRAAALHADDAAPMASSSTDALPPPPRTHYSYTATRLRHYLASSPAPRGSPPPPSPAVAERGIAQRSPSPLFDHEYDTTCFDFEPSWNRSGVCAVCGETLARHKTKLLRHPRAVDSRLRAAARGGKSFRHSSFSSTTPPPPPLNGTEVAWGLFAAVRRAPVAAAAAADADAEQGGDSCGLVQGAPLRDVSPIPSSVSASICTPCQAGDGSPRPEIQLFSL